MADPGRFRRNGQVLWRRTGDGAILAHVDDDGFERLSPTGAAVWELLAEPTTIETVSAELAEVFEGTEAAIDGDVATIIDQLVERGLVEPDDGV
jgi:coenzyme PQQ synthesis protein D (PqqD)